MPLVILHHLLNISVQLANKRGLKKKIHKEFQLFTENELRKLNKAFNLKTDNVTNIVRSYYYACIGITGGTVVTSSPCRPYSCAKTIFCREEQL
jgi:hypothetical protein